MKVEELLRLMVGDILYACYNEEGVDFRIPVIIDGIDNLGHDDCFIDWHPLGSEDSSEVHAEGFEPIPLTPEILEKNGFKKTDKTHPYYPDYYHTRDGFTIFNSRTWHGHILNSVHELQHALRLCGLTDLADNFQV